MLEWLGEPEDAPHHLTEVMVPSGQLSLMFYNFNSSLLERAVRSQFSEALREVDCPADPRADGAVPLRERDVRQWLAAQVAFSGILFGAPQRPL